ncbi:hypothetical protein U9M48_044378 [Paspalum notatum var. saurae]|uniref:Uncharacterized protein n=1 Tax=Paspalum notatum var. saurae TaxID=547442 RepID=A0AAQ3UVI6_PASNO
MPKPWAVSAASLPQDREQRRTPAFSSPVLPFPQQRALFPPSLARVATGDDWATATATVLGQALLGRALRRRLPPTQEFLYTRDVQGLRFLT